MSTIPSFIEHSLAIIDESKDYVSGVENEDDATINHLEAPKIYVSTLPSASLHSSLQS